MYKRILVPLDGSAAADRGLREAIRLARQQRATLRLLHVIDQSAMAAYPEPGFYAPDLLEVLESRGRKLLDAASKRARKHKIRVDTFLYSRYARVADVIVKQARVWRADIIVLGTHGRRGMVRLLMGSDAEQVLRNSPVPVLLVRAQGRSSRRSR